MTKPDKGQLIEMVRKAAELNGGSINPRDFQRIMDITCSEIAGLYEGGWRALARDAAVSVSYNHTRVPEEELFADLYLNTFSLGRLPTRREITTRCAFSYSAFSNRFGEKAALVRRYKNWLKEKFPEMETPEYFNIRDRGMWRRPRKAAWKTGFKGPAPVIAGVVCGAPLNFRAMLHEPVNEMGVVALFAMMCPDLDFVIESVRPGYPDCTAKRRLAEGKDLWGTVRIEFEFVSSNFREHDHDPSGCDLIVCWMHDWPDCPLQVLELKSAVMEVVRMEKA